MTAVVHQPRVAWDAARAFVRAAADDRFSAFAIVVGGELGWAYHHDLIATRERLRSSPRLDITHVEAGTWRVRLEDLLRYHPDLTDVVRRLTTAAPG